MQWLNRVRMRDRNLNIKLSLIRQSLGLSHMRCTVLTTARASTRRYKGVVQWPMVRFGRQGAIRWYLLISHAHVGNQGSTTFHVSIMWQRLSVATSEKATTTWFKFMGGSTVKGEEMSHHMQNKIYYNILH